MKIRNMQKDLNHVMPAKFCWNDHKGIKFERCLKTEDVLWNTYEQSREVDNLQGQK